MLCKGCPGAGHNGCFLDHLKIQGCPGQLQHKERLQSEEERLNILDALQHDMMFQVRELADPSAPVAHVCHVCERRLRLLSVDAAHHKCEYVERAAH